MSLGLKNKRVLNKDVLPCVSAYMLLIGGMLQLTA